jgi:hypothetical protein
MIRGRIDYDRSFLETFRRFSLQRLERAALVATDKAARIAQKDLREAMLAARLGRLGNAFGRFSDLEKGRVFRRGSAGFSASAGIMIKAGSGERGRGAIEAYTQGAEIKPVKGRWLWIATAELGAKRVNRKKITPALYKAGGLEQKIGPLVFIPGSHSGEALLIVRDVSVSRSGTGRARRIGKSGRVAPTREQKDFIVAFVGIRRTSREQRVNIIPIMQAARDRIGGFINTELRD